MPTKYMKGEEKVRAVDNALDYFVTYQASFMIT